MHNRTLFLLISMFLCSELFSLTNTEIEKIYFELEGIWASTKTYGSSLQNNRHGIYNGFWGKIKYNANASFVFNPISDNPSFNYTRIKSIEIDNDLYVLEMDLGSVQQNNRYHYLQSLGENLLISLKRDDSIGRIDIQYVKFSGPRRLSIDFKAALNRTQDVYLLPTRDSKIVGSLKNQSEVNVTQMTLRPVLVEEYEQWVRVSFADSIEGWIPRNSIRPSWSVDK